MFKMSLNSYLWLFKALIVALCYLPASESGLKSPCPIDSFRCSACCTNQSLPDGSILPCSSADIFRHERLTITPLGPTTSFERSTKSLAGSLPIPASIGLPANSFSFPSCWPHSSSCETATFLRPHNSQNSAESPSERPSRSPESKAGEPSKLLTNCWRGLCPKDGAGSDMPRNSGNRSIDSVSPGSVGHTLKECFEHPSQSRDRVHTTKYSRTPSSVTYSHSIATTQLSIPEATRLTKYSMAGCSYTPIQFGPPANFRCGHHGDRPVGARVPVCLWNNCSNNYRVGRSITAPARSLSSMLTASSITFVAIAAPIAF